VTGATGRKAAKGKRAATAKESGGRKAGKAKTTGRGPNKLRRVKLRKHVSRGAGLERRLPRRKRRQRRRQLLLGQ